MYKIDEKLAQTILDYLSKQPYANVFQLINALQSLEEIKEEKNKNEKPK